MHALKRRKDPYERELGYTDNIYSNFFKLHNWIHIRAFFLPVITRRVLRLLPKNIQEPLLYHHRCTMKNYWVRIEGLVHVVSILFRLIIRCFSCFYTKSSQIHKNIISSFCVHAMLFTNSSSLVYENASFIKIFLNGP